MNKELLEIRKRIKAKKPKFFRQDAHKKKRLKKVWRKPKGIHSKMRLNKKGYRRSISKGYKSPKEVRGLHKSGLEAVLVSSIKSLEKIENEKQGIIISKGVGLRKKIELIKKAEEKGIRVLSMKNAKKFLESAENIFKKRKEEKDAEEKRKKEKVKKPVTKKKGREEEKTEKEKKEEEKTEKEKILTKKQ